MPWIIVLKPSYRLSGGRISKLSVSVGNPCSNTTTPTAQAELRSLVAVSKSIAANDWPRPVVCSLLITGISVRR